jgi:DNA-directed RNA polymerase subunit RPC12/RpoP
MPSKGKCSHCGSTALQFKEDGRGRCRDCKHKFWWDKSQQPKKGGGGGRERGGGGGEKRPPKCPECGKRMEFIKKYKRFYCWECNLYED